MVDLNSLLITLLYVAGFVLLVVFIIIGIKLITTHTICIMTTIILKIMKFNKNYFKYTI